MGGVNRAMGIRGSSLRRMGRTLLFVIAGAAAIGAVSRMVTKRPPVDIEVNSRCRGAACMVDIKVPAGVNFLDIRPQLGAKPDCKILDMDVLTERALRARTLGDKCDLRLRYLDKVWTFSIE